jgi:8-oxo-dGTP diphosphatase
MSDSADAAVTLASVSGAPVGRASLGSACAVFDSEGRILLVRHTYGERNWELPGGLADAGEDFRTTARRELREETGLDLHPARLSGVYYEPSHELGPFLHATFRVEWPGRPAPQPTSAEIDAVTFWPVTDLPRPLSDLTARRVEDATQDTAAFAVIEARTWLP